MTTCPTCGSTEPYCVKLTTGERSPRLHAARRDAEVIRTDLTPEQVATLDEEATVWASFTDVQADAIRATATRHLRDPLELALEMFPLLYEPAAPASAGGDSAVKEDLTPTTELPVTEPETFTVTFYASGGTL